MIKTLLLTAGGERLLPDFRHIVAIDHAGAGAGDSAKIRGVAEHRSIGVLEVQGQRRGRSER